MQTTHIKWPPHSSTAHGYRTSAWLQEPAQTTDIHMAFSGKTGHGEQQTGCSRTKDPDIVIGGSRAADINMALGGCTGHSHQHGLWPEAQLMDIRMVSGQRHTAWPLSLTCARDINHVELTVAAGSWACTGTSGFSTVWGSGP